MTKNSPKIPNFAAAFRRSRNGAQTACQLVSDSKLNVEHDAHIYFAQNLQEMPQFGRFCQLPGPKRLLTRP